MIGTAESREKAVNGELSNHLVSSPGGPPNKRVRKGIPPVFDGPS